MLATHSLFSFPPKSSFHGLSLPCGYPCLRLRLRLRAQPPSSSTVATMAKRDEDLTTLLQLEGERGTTGGLGDSSISVNLVKKNTGSSSHGSATNPSLESDAFIGLDAMQRANSTLEDFCRSYYMFHGMDENSPEAIFKYLPMLSFTESFIYQLDALNEKIVEVTVNKEADPNGKSDEVCRLNKVFESEPLRPLTLLLENHGLLTQRIRKELKDGEEYWALERRLCNAIEQTEISIEDVLRGIELKSFDYRFLNLLLYQLRGAEVNDLHMEFLTISEYLVEVSDDLFDYEEDVLENNFNILRMFVRIYGADASTKLAKNIAEAEEKCKKLSESLDPELYSSYKRRCEEATREGGKVYGYPLAPWNIPPLIMDEEQYRSKRAFGCN
ncbi:hypothetical protein SOVF_023700 [Spinacia oleracea]|nr:hypothetical protein SOVF_023700 [Spinacia oleracea]